MGTWSFVIHPGTHSTKLRSFCGECAEIRSIHRQVLISQVPASPFITMTLKQYIDDVHMFIFRAYIQGTVVPEIRLLNVRPSLHGIPLAHFLSVKTAFQVLQIVHDNTQETEPVTVTLINWVTIEYKRIGNIYVKTVYACTRTGLDTDNPLYQEQVPDQELQEDINDSETIFR